MFDHPAVKHIFLVLDWNGTCCSSWLCCSRSPSGHLSGELGAAFFVAPVSTWSQQLEEHCSKGSPAVRGCSHHALRLVAYHVIHSPCSAPVQSISPFGCRGVTHVQSFVKVKVNGIHCSPLIHQTSLFVVGSDEA